ncbi:MAG: ABC transporter ATP-binding protein [Clostridia bacterium]|nr:ABC transporter ATP-binding protein [Clostridia bacterium]
MHNTTDNKLPLLQLKDLSIGIHEKGQVYTAVDGISYNVYPGEILGVVGESGCGKTVTNLAIMGLLPEVLFVQGGEILYRTGDGADFPVIDLAKCSPEERRKLNGSAMSIIFQEPMTSLNPLMKVGKQAGEALRIHKKLPSEEVRRRVLEAFEDVGLPDPEGSMEKYPHQLSGGQRQRVMIAMATLLNPRLLIADEPTTALDVTIQAQVLALLKKINREKNTSIIFISHDLAVIRQICDRVIVMYAGKIAETGTTSDILERPVHPYTNGLIASIPKASVKGRNLASIPGHVPSTEEKRLPCPFANRCVFSANRCRTAPPKVYKLSDTHTCSCHYAVSFAAEYRNQERRQ